MSDWPFFLPLSFALIRSGGRVVRIRRGRLGSFSTRFHDVRQPVTVANFTALTSRGTSGASDIVIQLRCCTSASKSSCSALCHCDRTSFIDFELSTLESPIS